MEALNDYFALMLLICLAAGLFGAILHEHARDISILAIGAVFLSSLVSPLFSVISEIGEIPTLPETAPLPVGGISDAIEVAFAEGIREFISSEWGVPPDEIDVVISRFSAYDARAGELSVTLTGTGAFVDTRSMRDALASEFLVEGGKCTVVIDFG